MKKMSTFMIILMIIIVTGIQIQMFTLKKTTLENREVITQQIEVLRNVVDYLKGF